MLVQLRPLVLTFTPTHHLESPVTLTRIHLDCGGGDGVQDRYRMYYSFFMKVQWQVLLYHSKMVQ